LKASVVEVEASFDREDLKLPAVIDPRDGRMEAVREWFARLDPRSSLVDAGCGPGRFLAKLAIEFPAARFTGVDPSSRLVSGLPHGIEGRRGSLLNLPAADGQFDAALAVESLEHALLAQRAVDELCRVVRPGGSILIIDKDLARQGLSEHEPWEQWFAPGEVSRWLSRHCTDVAVRQVCHVPAYRKRPLFLAWTARRSHNLIERSIA
jgi:malonyl-CoA O-methyltransferase